MTSHEDMRATTMMAYELGYRGKFLNDRLETTADVYWDEYSNMLASAFRPGPPGLLRFDLDTRSDYSLYGVEASAKYKLTKQLTLLGNYTFEMMDWRGAMGPCVEQDFVTPPKHKFMLGARYDPIPDLHLSTQVYYVDAVTAPNSTIPLLPRRIPRYFRLDLRAEYEFWKKQASVAVGVRNLLDPSHPEGGTQFLNNAEVPRMIYAEMRFTIK